MKKSDEKSSNNGDKWYSAWHPSNKSSVWSYLIIIIVVGAIGGAFWLRHNNSSNLALQPQYSGAAQVESLEQRITPLTKELLDTAKELRTADAASKTELVSRIKTLASSRKKLLIELAVLDSKAVKRHVISPGLQKKLPAEVQSLLETEVTLEGTLEWLHSDDFDNSKSKDEFFVNKNGRKTKLQMSDFPKAKPGDRIKVTAVELDNANVVASANEVQVTAAAEIAAANVNKKVAVILFKQSNAKSSGVSATQARADIFTGANSVNAYYKENSFGQWGLTGHLRPDGDVFGTYTIALPGDGCDYRAWAPQAEAAAVADGFVRENYDNIIYIFPQNTSFCSWGGLAYINQSPGQSWINQFLIGTIAHELGHNYALHHAGSLDCKDTSGTRVTISDNCTTTEYGDLHDTMGSNFANKHFSVYHKGETAGYSPNWFSGSNATTVDLAVNPNAEYVLTPIEQGGTGLKSLRVPRDYMVNGGLNNGFYYIEYRQPIGFDAPRSSTELPLNGVLMRLASDYPYISKSQLLDMTPSTPSFNDSTLGAGKSFSDTAKGIKFTVISSSATEARVRVESLNVCTTTNPTLTLTPTTQTGTAGTTLTYSLTITNNDSGACSARSLAINPTLPTGWSQTPASLNESLLPGATVTRSVLVTSDSLAVSDSYNVTETSSGSTASTIYIVSSSTSNPNGGDTVPPKSSVITPANNTSVSKKGKLTIKTTASDNVAVTKMNVYLDEALIKTCMNATVCDAVTSLNGMSAGPHQSKAESFDAAGNTNNVITVFTHP